MTCAQARARMQLYLDGRLHGQQLPILARHLQECHACRADLAVLNAIVEAAGSVDPLRQPEALTRSIMWRIRQAEAQALTPAASRNFALAWADAILAAVLATVMTVIFLFFQPALRAPLARAVALAIDSLTHGITLVASSWSPLVIWLVWIGLGVVLTLWFAGREVRAGWRRTLVARLSR